MAKKSEPNGYTYNVTGSEEVFNLTERQHEKLLQLVKDKMAIATEKRPEQIARFRRIDNDINGFIIHTANDAKADADNAEGRAPKPVPARLQLAGAKIDDIVTFIMSVVAPDDALYGAVAGIQDQSKAKALTSIMNKHGEIFGHYQNYCKGILDMLKYNFGGWLVEWTARDFKILRNTELQTLQIEQAVQQGNSVIAIDPYNFVCDPSVPPEELAMRGEFAAMISVKTRFAVEREARNGTFTNLEQVKDWTSLTETYYEELPDFIKPTQTQSVGRKPSNWQRELANGKSSKSNQAELWDMYLWTDMAEIAPRLKDKGYGVWLITVLNGRVIVRCQKLTYAHERLPFGLCCPSNDGLGLFGKAIAEILLPLQSFASFALNTHQAAIQKKLYGMVLYDSTALPLGDMKHSDLLGARIPVKTTAQGTDIRSTFAVLNDAPDTSSTMMDIRAAVDLMNNLMPTDMQRQVASLERATEYQAAATVQSASKRLLKFAKVIDAQALKQVRQQQVYNIYQSNEVIEIPDDNGVMKSVSAADIRDIDLEFLISDGLKGLDRLLLANGLKEVIHMLLQNPEERAKVNMLGMIQYYFSLMGDKTDFRQFIIKSQWDSLTPEQKDMAVQSLQAAEAAEAQGGMNGIPNPNAGSLLPPPSGGATGQPIG